MKRRTPTRTGRRDGCACNGAGGASIGYPVDLMTIARERRERETDATFLVNATDLTGKFDTGIINHTLTAGVELSRETRNQTRTDLCVAANPGCCMRQA